MGVSNKLLHQAVTRILSHQETTQMSLSVRLSSPSIPTFSRTITRIDTFTLIQNFGENYGDDIVMSFNMAPKDYSTLYDNRHDLEAVLKIVYVSNQTQRVVYNVKPVIKRYRVLLVDAHDMRRVIQGARFRVEETYPVKIRLIDPVLYDLRQREFHGIFRNVTVEAVLRHIASSFGVTLLNLAPPDNTHVYDHVIIPPSQGFDAVFAYVQDTYGVYFKGLVAYFTDGVLHIYPPFSYGQEDFDVAHLYLGEQGDYAGGTSYHRRTEDLLEIVLDGTPEVVDLSQMGGETYGTGIALVRSGQVMDSFMATEAEGSTFNHATGLTIEDPDAAVLTPGRHNIRHSAITSDNVFAQMAQLAKYNAEIVVATWIRAVPDLLRPGHRLKYLYDNDGLVATRRGILEAVGYVFERVSMLDGVAHNYVSHAKVRFRVQPKAE
jgi:hypothetical protein